MDTRRSFVAIDAAITAATAILEPRTAAAAVLESPWAAREQLR